MLAAGMLAPSGSIGSGSQVRTIVTTYEYCSRALVRSKNCLRNE